MGYFTTYSIEFEGNSQAVNGLMNHLEEPPEEKILGDYGCLHEYIYSVWEGDRDLYHLHKWYEHEKDMKLFSKSYPRILFILEGEGKESDDMWKLYVRNGKAFRVSPAIIWPDLDKADISKRLGE